MCILRDDCASCSSSVSISIVSSVRVGAEIGGAGVAGAAAPAPHRTARDRMHIDRTFTPSFTLSYGLSLRLRSKFLRDLASG